MNEDGWLNLTDQGKSTPPPDKCNPSILGKAGTGAVLSLDAIGLQDTFLISNPTSNTDTSNISSSFFQFTNIQHTNFTKYSTSVKFTSDGSTNWPFGQVYNISLRPKEMGDILHNMYLKCTLPPLPHPHQYCTNIGWSIIKEVQLSLDDVILEIIKCDWNVLYTELHYTVEEREIIAQMINVDPINGGNLYIPLNFFFNRRHSSSYTGNPLVHENIFKPGLLTCAAHKHRNIILTFTFNPITFFTTASTVSLSNVYLVTDEIILDDRERQFLQNNTQKNMVSFARNDPMTPIKGTPFTHNLTPNISVKTLHWFARNAEYEDTSNSYYFNNRFNFTHKDYDLPFSATNTMQQQESNNPVISQSIIYLNGVALLGLSKPTTVRNIRDGSYYYKFTQPFNHFLTVPSKNIYTYSFCVKPRDPQPSGSLDFSQMDSTTTFLTGSLYSFASSKKTWNFYVYYTGYNQITYSNGLASLDFGW